MLVLHPNLVFFRRLLSVILLMLITMAGFALSATARADSSESTLATVSFIDGDLELGGEVGGSGLNLNFGEQYIPVTGISYPAINNASGTPVDHILRVEDSRFDSGEWQVTVSLTQFIDVTDTADNFHAMISFLNPAVANANASAGTVGLTVEQDVQVNSQGGAVPVMTADDALNRGIFTATWKNENVTLNISDEEVANIGLAHYSATLNWTLEQGPF